MVQKSTEPERLILNIANIDGSSRAGTMTLPHGAVRTPVFMPVGTQGAMKGVTFEQIETLVDCDLVLGNTYHLGLCPGEDTLRELGGLHGLTGWRRNFLTDSGGFQMVSLLQLAQVTEDGVTFQSSHDGRLLLLRPEDSMRIQNALGSDIMMQLDDVVHPQTERHRLEEAMYRSIRWLDRCIKAHSHSERQHLFAIIQGGLDLDLRSICIQEMLQRDCPGYAIGGLSGGESKEAFWRTVAHCTRLLPDHKPRYLMGVGYPVDVVVCIALGVDMFDCVYPSRTARFGTALTSEGNIQLTHAKYAHDDSVLDACCDCQACTRFTRKDLHHLATKSESSCGLLTIHNLTYMTRLTREIRQSILENRIVAFIQAFMKSYFPNGNVPQWIHDALESVQISLN